MQALLNTIAAMPLPADAQRVFHGRGGTHPGSEHWSLDYFAPVWVLTSFEATSDEELAIVGAALAARWALVSPGAVLNWVFQSRHDRRSPTRLMAGGVPDPHIVSEDGARYRVHVQQGQNHGLFLDMAEGRRWVRRHAAAHPRLRVLNLFAYTGGASLAARAAGADVTHCDSVKAVLNWASANMQASRLSDIRWLLEDAFKFVQREARRERTYHGIILDPPAYGHGPNGEKWKLEEMVNDLTAAVAKILDPEQYFLVFNSYSLGFSPLVLQNLVHTHFGDLARKRLETGEIYLQERSGRQLPGGIFARFRGSR